MPVLDKWELFEHPIINWKPNPAQLTVAENGCRHKVLAGGRRLGKDYLAGTDKLLPEVFYTKPLASTLLSEGRKRIFWIVGPSYSESEKTFRVIWNWCKRLEIPMEKGSFNSPEIGLMQIRLWGGALEIIAKSAQVPERLVGEGLSGVIMCEAAKMRSIIWPKYIQPTLADFSGWSYFGSCVTADTLVYTEDGIKEIGSLSQERQPGHYAPLGVRVAGFAGSHQMASQFYCNGLRETRRVTVTNGYRIEGTPNHRVWVMNSDGNPGWKYLGDIATGDYVAVRCGAELWGTYGASDFVKPIASGSGRWQEFDTTLDEDMAYFLGLLIGDGSYPKVKVGRPSKCGVTIHCGIDDEIAEFCENFGMHIDTIEVEGKRVVRKAHLQSFQLTKFLEHLGFEECKSWERHIPSKVLAVPRKQMLHLLAGLFDSDGAYNRTKHKLWYSSTSEKLVRQIQVVLLNLGVVSSVLRIKPKTEGWHDTWRLELTSSATTKLQDQLPLSVIRKKIGYEERGLGDLSVSKLPYQQERLQRIRSRYNMRGKARDTKGGVRQSTVEPWVNKMPGVSKVTEYLDRVASVFPEAESDSDVKVLRALCKEGYVWSQVKNVEAGEAETFDLCVPNTHAYAANGIIGHNTPEGKNWFYELWRHAQDPFNTEWASWRMPSWINYHVYKQPTKAQHVYKCLEMMRRSRTSAHKLAAEHNFVIDPEILGRLNDLPPELFMQEIAADFSEYVGRVFKDFDEETHVTDLTYNPGWDTYAAIDFGFSNPNVYLLIQVGKWGEINVLDEIYETGLDPEDFANEIRYRGLNPPNLHYIFADPADPGATRILEKKLGVRSHGNTGGPLDNRLNWIRKLLREPRYVVEEPYHDISLDGLTVGQARPRLMFDRKCKRTIEDMLAYRYPEKKEDKETSTKRFDLPLKRDDHGPEALGRFCAGYFGQFGKESQGTKVHASSFSRSTTAESRKKPTNTKTLAHMRPALHENRRTQFPKTTNGLSNYLQGVYDD